jgi:hypothetical protein
MPKLLPRPYMLPSGTETFKHLELCRCVEKERRGPQGGVCGKCGGAIPTDEELRRILT